ncbi:phosphotransferase enzyme family-domain-containing protein [Microdochium bolleyi]|uniref:Phosphotransferase enzyme family-domain-containing protein n=1 Tax=Microdochium bolleyi TaxID=196109 RepID=A0A136J3P0_9PEZI|nr:phosphotransferase enzyme family-domain-containing protein [Microdochium bolleyi]
MTPAPAARRPQDGLAWHEQLSVSVPLWTRLPDETAIKRICRNHLIRLYRDNDVDTACTVSFFASDAFNKFYLATTKHRKGLMRVSLPVYPAHKTRGEVATLRWVRKNSSIPVPRVLAFDDTNSNELGFEWILTEFMPGEPAERVWWTMSRERKEALVRRLASYQAELARAATTQAFDTIGTLIAVDCIKEFPARSWTPLKVRFDRLVAPEVFLGSRLKLKGPRGPYRSSQEWFTGTLSMIIQVQNNIIGQTTGDRKFDRLCAETTRTIAEKLLRVLPKVFPGHDLQTDTHGHNTAEQTYLHHDNLNLQNILLDEKGAVSGILNWEFVSALPLWTSARLPQFLRDNQGWAEVNYNRTVETPEYKNRAMTRSTKAMPSMTLRKESLLKVYMYEAVLSCASWWFLEGICRWADAIEAGTVIKDGTVQSWMEF